MKPKDIYKYMHENLPRLLHTLAQGYLVVGHPGAMLLQTYVVTVKQYGFNVILDDVSSDVVRNSIDASIRRSKGNEKQASLVTFIENINREQLKQYWVNLITMGDKVEASPYGGAEGREEAEVFLQCRNLRLSTRQFPTPASFNPKPLVTFNPIK